MCGPCRSHRIPAALTSLFDSSPGPRGNPAGARSGRPGVRPCPTPCRPGSNAVGSPRTALPPPESSGPDSADRSRVAAVADTADATETESPPVPADGARTAPNCAPTPLRSASPDGHRPHGSRNRDEPRRPELDTNTAAGAGTWARAVGRPPEVAVGERRAPVRAPSESGRVELSRAELGRVESSRAGPGRAGPAESDRRRPSRDGKSATGPTDLTTHPLIRPFLRA